MKKYLSLVLLCSALSPWAFAADDDADILNDNIAHDATETVATMRPMAQAGQEAFSLPRHTLGALQ